MFYVVVRICMCGAITLLALLQEHCGLVVGRSSKCVNVMKEQLVSLEKRNLSSSFQSHKRASGSLLGKVDPFYTKNMHVIDFPI